MQRYIDELRLLHALELSVLATDSDGVITFVNDAAARTFATTPEDLVGRKVVELVGAAAGDGAFDLAAVLAGATWRGDLTVRRPHGDAFLAAVSATAIR